MDHRTDKFVFGNDYPFSEEGDLSSIVEYGISYVEKNKILISLMWSGGEVFYGTARPLGFKSGFYSRCGRFGDRSGKHLALSVRGI
ncbi:hypothetical protein PLACP1_25980 [Planifilum fimeticola]